MDARLQSETERAREVRVLSLAGWVAGIGVWANTTRPAQAYRMRGNIVYGAVVVSDPPTIQSEPSTSVEHVPWDSSASFSFETMTPSTFVSSTRVGWDAGSRREEGEGNTKLHRSVLGIHFARDSVLGLLFRLHRLIGVCSVHSTRIHSMVSVLELI